MTSSGFLTYWGLTIIHALSSHGVIYWTILFAKDFPLLSAGASITLAATGYNLWIRTMRKALRTLRYS